MLRDLCFQSQLQKRNVVISFSKLLLFYLKIIPFYLKIISVFIIFTDFSKCDFDVELVKNVLPLFIGTKDYKTFMGKSGINTE